MPYLDDRMARNRVRFLTSEPVDPHQVREAILTSWWRSRQFRVPADRIDLPYVNDQDLDTPLIRAAAPVLARLGEQLDGQPISLILTDRAGVVLTQHTCDPDLRRQLERVELMPGFSYGEQFVGTNGIGTALEDGRPTYVFGHEHYAEHLEDLACAGVPIRHPVSGKTIGAVDLTCWRKDAGKLLVAMAHSTAEQIRQALLIHSSMRELTLFQSYLQACRHTTGIVMAFNTDIMMVNDRARHLLGPTDQSLLLEQARGALSDRSRATVTAVLATGSRVRLRCHRVPGLHADDIAGAVVSAQLIEPDDERDARPGAVAARRSAMVPMFLPGVVGSTPVWRRCCQQVDAHYDEGDWLMLAGEAGAGRYTLARAVHQRRNPAGRLHSLDAVEAGCVDDVRRELVDDPVDTLIIRHVDGLDSDGVSALADALRQLRDRHYPAAAPWVVLTLGPKPEMNPDLAALLMLFPHTVQVPPLRHHAEDLNELVPLMLSTLGHASALTCSPAAMHLLMRANWPGNIGQLHRVLRDVTRHRRAGTIQPADLPPEFRTVTSRSLGRLESMERDAVVQSLEDAGGNKAQAAKLLGVSRASIYRKIHDYGIVIPDRSCG